MSKHKIGVLGFLECSAAVAALLFASGRIGAERGDLAIEEAAHSLSES